MSRLRLRLPAFHTQLTSFLGVLDLRVGATVVTLFALFNKIAGVYGVIAIFQGGTFAQVSMYMYSLITMIFFLWAIKGISDEDANRVMKYAHLFLADHLVSTTWTLFFGLDWFMYNKHDGQKPPLNEYQAGLMGLIEQIEGQYETSKNIHHVPLAGQERVDAAQRVWKGERGFSATVLTLGWLLKVYFALVIYSYALHLRHGTYRTLPLSKPSNFGSAQSGSNGVYHALRAQSFELGAVEEEDGILDDDNEETARRRQQEQHQQTRQQEGPKFVDANGSAESASTMGAGISRPQSRIATAGRRENGEDDH